MNQLFRFPNSVKRDPAVEVWMNEHTNELGVIAQHWFEVMRKCGDDVRELLHDGHPTACVDDAAFAYVNAFKAHVNIGFFRGAEIADPQGLLVEETLLINGEPNRVNPNHWRPLIMSFQRFYGLGTELHESDLASIPEQCYKSPDNSYARSLDQ